MDMSGLLLLAAAGVVAVALVLLLVALLVGSSRSRRELARAQAETAELRARLDALSDRLESTSAELVETREAAAYLITDAGLEQPTPNVPDRVVLSAAVGEPLVRAVALGHGVRRALSAESRNRIRFEMRREVRRARKQRRREMKDAWRRARTEESAA